MDVVQEDGDGFELWTSTTDQDLSVPVRERASVSTRSKAGAFNIFTIPGGFNGGRTYCIRLSSEGEADDWVQTIRQMVMLRGTLQWNAQRGRALRLRLRSLARSLCCACVRSLSTSPSFVGLFLSSSQKTPRQHKKWYTIKAGLSGAVSKPVNCISINPHRYPYACMQRTK